MLHAPRLLDHSHPGTALLEPSSRSALIVAGVVLFSAGLLVLPLSLGAFEAFRYLFLLLGVLVGLVLYTTFPILYIGYTWWLWFLTPLLRRIVDYHAGWQNPSLIMLTLYVVTGLSFFTLLRHRTQLLNKAYLPFLLVLAGLGYGYVIGLLSHGPFRASDGLLQWLLPVLFGFHVTMHWEDYPALRRCIQRTFLWGVAVMGVYAIIQYYVMPPWDSFWMNQFEWITRVGGNPRPFELRVFSTMSTYGLFSTIMMVGLLVLFSTVTWKHLLAGIPGYLGLLLTFKRTAWVGWLLALVLTALSIKGHLRKRLVGVLLLGTLILLPLLSVPEISGRVTNRLESFQNLSDDGSLNARIEVYQDISSSSLTNPIGAGIGFRPAGTGLWDSGLLMIPYVLGWPGLAFFVLGLAFLLHLLWQSPRRTGDAFAAICSAIAFAILALLVSKNSLLEASGGAFWCFAGLSLASYRYHKTQENEASYTDER